MKKMSALPAIARQRGHERGAALITMLLITTLLLAAGGALILTTSMATTTTIDSAAEIQAYYGAEAGLEATLNVLRGNVVHGAGVPSGTKMSFRTAYDPIKSNNSGVATQPAILSGWLTYTGNWVNLGNNISYSVVINDPDDLARTKLAANPAYEPSRLLVQVTGRGPKGATKKIQAIVSPGGFPVSSMFYMRSADYPSPMHFTVSNSASQVYTGQDAASAAVLPTIATYSVKDYNVCQGADISKNVIKDTPQCAIVDPPWFLKTADTARAFSAMLEAKAKAMGRYFTTMPVGNSGTDAAPKFTFVDGDTDLVDGAGLLVVTGNLHIGSADTFKGIIVVLSEGSASSDVSTSGGNNHVRGAIYVASFNATGGFHAPWWNTKNGGALHYQYDSSWVQKAAFMLGVDVQAISEY